MKKDIEISHLVVNGCSFTFCQGLVNPKIEGWPALVASRLGLPVVNLAARGSSCDGILRRTYDYFYRDLKNNNKPFYVTGWTAAIRREEYLDHKGCFTPVFVNNPTTPLEQYLASQMTLRGISLQEVKKLIYWSSVINLMKTNNIPYIMTDFIPRGTPERKFLERYYSEIYTLVENDSNRIQDITAYIDPFKKDNYFLPCGHYSAEGNKIIADFIYNNICERYTIIPVKFDYVSNKDYITEPNVVLNNIWI